MSEDFISVDEHFGQVAYEGYCDASDWKSLVSGAQLPPWHNLPGAIQAAWMSAAEAVRRAPAP
jgi:hypothetical protein